MCGHLKLLEKEYFGLEFRHQGGNYVRNTHASVKILLVEETGGVTVCCCS